MYPLPGERYQHYKGGIYEIISINVTFWCFNFLIILIVFLDYSGLSARKDEWEFINIGILSWIINQ